MYRTYEETINDKVMKISRYKSEAEWKRLSPSSYKKAQMIDGYIPKMCKEFGWLDESTIDANLKVEILMMAGVCKDLEDFKNHIKNFIKKL